MRDIQLDADPGPTRYASTHAAALELLKDVQDQLVFVARSNLQNPPRNFQQFLAKLEHRDDNTYLEALFLTPLFIDYCCQRGNYSQPGA